MSLDDDALDGAAAFLQCCHRSLAKSLQGFQLRLLTPLPLFPPYVCRTYVSSPSSWLYVWCCVPNNKSSDDDEFPRTLLKGCPTCDLRYWKSYCYPRLDLL